MISEKTIKALEENGFNVYLDGACINIQQYTPAGEDWNLSFYDDSDEDIKNYCENYEPEEDFAAWYEGKQNGVKGVPTVPELWKDQLWKQETLNKVLETIK